MIVAFLHPEKRVKWASSPPPPQSLHLPAAMPAATWPPALHRCLMASSDEAGAPVFVAPHNFCRRLLILYRADAGAVEAPPVCCST